MFTPHRTAVLLILVTAMLYAPTLGYGFIYEDLNDPERFFAPWTHLSWTQPARSLTLLTFAATEALFPQDPRAYHAGSVLVHLLNGGLLYGLATAILRPWAAIVALGVFLLHPVQVESVAYVANRPDLVAATTLLLGLWAVNAQRWFLVALACVAAFLAKETMLVAPALFLLFALWRGVRVPWTAITALCVVSVPIGLYMLASYPVSVDATYLLTQLAAFSRLLALVFWPVGLTIDHDWSFSALTLITTSGLWALLVSVAWMVRETPLALAIAWCLIVVSPRLVVPLVEGLHEHHLYAVLPVLSLWFGAVWFPRKEGYGVSETFAQA